VTVRAGLAAGALDTRDRRNPAIEPIGLIRPALPGMVGATKGKLI
jgi:hypothetical protein